MTTTKKYLTMSLCAVVSLLIHASAQAEYRLTAFPEGRGYDAISTSNPDEAIDSFSNRRINRLEFWDLNNLCVSQIMVGDFVNAISNCELSLHKISRERSVSTRQKRRIEATVYSNLAVARAKDGDLEGAHSDLEVALRANARDENARSNMEQISQNLVADN